VNNVKCIDPGYRIVPIIDQEKKFKGNTVKFNRVHQRWQEKVYCTKTNKMIPNPLFRGN